MHQSKQIQHVAHQTQDTVIRGSNPSNPERDGAQCPRTFHTRDLYAPAITARTTTFAKVVYYDQTKNFMTPLSHPRGEHPIFQICETSRSHAKTVEPRGTTFDKLPHQDNKYTLPSSPPHTPSSVPHGVRPYRKVLTHISIILLFK